MRSYSLTIVCLLHGHWHVSKNNAAPFLKDVKLAARYVNIRLVKVEF